MFGDIKMGNQNPLLLVKTMYSCLMNIHELFNVPSFSINIFY